MPAPDAKPPAAGTGPPARRPPARRSSRIGDLALERGLLSETELATLLEGTTQGPPPGGRAAAARTRLGELLVRERYLTAPLLIELLEEQRRRRVPSARRAAAAFAPATGASVDDYVLLALTRGARELLLLTDKPPALRAPDVLVPTLEPAIEATRMRALVDAVFPPEDVQRADRGERVTRVHAARGHRFRVELGRSEQGWSMALQRIGLSPDADGLTLPEAVAPLADLRRGLVVVAGAQAPFRASVLAKLVDLINARSRRHVITVERTLAYEHASRLALVAQREVGVHTASYERALRASLREDPDVLAIGEIRGAEAIATALLAAETGHLVLCSLHAADATQALRRLVDVQASGRRGLVRLTLASSLQAVVVVGVIAGKGGERHLVADVLPGTPAVTHMIRDDRLHQLASVGPQPGGVSRDEQVRALLRKGLVTRVAALECVADASAVDLPPLRPEAPPAPAERPTETREPEGRP